MQKTTVGKILLKSHLPLDLHPLIDELELDKSGTSKLLAAIYERHPKDYATILSGLHLLGFDTSARLGSTVSISDLHSPIDKEKEFASLESALRTAEKLEGKAAQDKEKLKIFSHFNERINKALVDVGVEKNQTLSKIVKAGARGSPTQLRQTIFAPVLVADQQGHPILDKTIKASYAEGLSLPEYLLSAFSGRAGWVGTKLSIADSGFLSKQLARGIMQLQVEEIDCGTPNGIVIGVDARDYIGTFLAKPAGTYNRNNEVTAKVLADLRNKGIHSIIVRSPITCTASRHSHTGAVCAMCCGKREKGLPQVGDYVGLTAATGISEGLSQGSLSSKHSAGSVASANLASGFDLAKQLLEIPETFKGKAATASHDGIVKDIHLNPQGGSTIKLEQPNGGHTEYYIPTGLNAKVKIGDKIEAGDIMSEGIPNPYEIVKHKGIGEGRMHLAKALREASESGGVSGVSKKNYDLAARGLIDHVRITHPDGLGDYPSNSAVSYQAIEKDYVPRETARTTLVDAAIGMYLEEPVMHLTIGTKITHKLASFLKSHGIQSVIAHPGVPAFEPEMIRLGALPEHVDDWMTGLYSTHLERKLMHAVNNGMTSNVEGYHPIPRIAYGSIGTKRAEELND
jgi:DNA-directed RNA polymerase subunit beta'